MLTSSHLILQKGYNFSLEIPEEPETLYVFSVFQGKIEISKSEEGFMISYNYTQNEDDRMFLIQLCECIGIGINDVKLVKETFNGKCLFPEQQLDMVIWKDLVMNRPEVYRHFAINENPQTARKTENHTNRYHQNSFHHSIYCIHASKKKDSYLRLSSSVF